MKRKPWERRKIDYKKLSAMGLKIRRKNGAFDYQRNNAAFHNKLGICNEQIMRRYLVVSDIVGREPSTVDINMYDQNLIKIIQRRYGTFNNFRKNNGFTVVERPKIFEDDELIACIRKWRFENKRNPMIKDFYGKHPSSITFRKRFGSWRNALRIAGLI